MNLYSDFFGTQVCLITAALTVLEIARSDFDKQALKKYIWKECN